MVTPLLIYGSTIRFVKTFDFLGFVIHSKLSRAAHIAKLTNTVSNSLM